ncbi:hypothetical protein HCN44_010760 [Aphidius gifuensis]|uniref:Uncharacterized protein n=1 Tax=Aphidius gifuensis TaxID=684658 RepID=A0A834XVI4_APHGI|nr:probable tubulin polyglutamylase ttll-15 [Aphidius gifuensis]KAF7991959.1 hypothetical protein HCN44_010760 [Aphidius gifuensis]
MTKSESESENSTPISKPKTKVLFKIIIIPILLSIICYYSLIYHKKYLENHVNIKLNESKPVYWLFSKSKSENHLKHVVIVLDRLGLHRGTDKSDWNILWSHEHPFSQLSTNFRGLKSHQRVNHIPGFGFITNKVDLSKTESPYIPASYKIPDDNELLLKIAKENPNKLFVQKSNNHRNIEIKNIENIDFKNDKSFVQEYIDKPYLIDGFKFDIGVYTVVTSIDPLRIYTYKGDVLFRFCPHEYHPFDQNDIDKYVVGDDYLPIWNVPSLKKYYVDYGFSMKETFDAYAKTKGQNPDKIWNNVYQAITSIVLDKEKKIAEFYNNYPSKRNFFEMVRFDFILDEDLNVFVMEANMSPNLSSAHYPPNRLLYEQVLFNLFALIGIGQRIDPIYRKPRNWKEREIEVADKNIAVLPDVCLKCDDCFRVECQICKPCFTDEMRQILGQCYTEHQNKMDYKRIFPPKITNDMVLKDYSMKNQLLLRWYQGKCEADSSWCD